MFFIAPADGSLVDNPVRMRFGFKRGNAASTDVAKEKSGHFHVIVDAPPPDTDKPFPVDENHIRFGEGQTEAELTLPPGKHRLQLLLDDGDQAQGHPPAFSAPIAITVQDAPAPGGY